MNPGHFTQLVKIAIAIYSILKKNDNLTIQKNMKNIQIRLIQYNI